MACSPSEPDKIKEICESLYTDSYFYLLRQRNNIPDVEDEYRNLVRQMGMQCSALNMSRTSTDDLKFQLISEYSSIVDNQNNANLLPIISDDLNIKNYPHSFTETDYSTQLLTARQHCMELIENKTNSTFPSNNDMQFKCPISILTAELNQCQKKLPDQNVISSNFLNNLTSFRNELSMKKSPVICNQNLQTLQSKNFNTSNKSSSVYLDKNQLHRKKSESFSGNSMKRRTTEDDIHESYFPKKQNPSFRQNLISNCQIETTKSSFMTASSMYKNPFIKSNSTEQESEPKNFCNNQESIKNHPSLKNFDSKIVGIIMSEIMDFSPDVKWSDVAGLNFVKSTVQEIVIWPLLRPDIFTGLRAPPRGILLFGPPGTGKTMIGKCIATESNSTFFCISASSLGSKWVGESEKLVRALFAIAQLHQPAVIFIDEIDSLLSQRSDKEQDHTRKLKTEFLVQFDGAKTNSERRILVVGATNRPHELDEAARRRFVKRLFVPLPDESARLQIVEKLLQSHQHNLSDSDFKRICKETEGYSGSDVAHLCKEAAMGPIRSIGPEQIKTVSLDQVRPIELIDFIDALKQVRASVVQEDLNYFLDWNKKFGSFPA